MIKLGKAWVDMTAVSAVVPAREAPGVSLFLNSGRIIGLTEVTEAEIVRALKRCGLVEEDGEFPPMSFTEEELVELEQAFHDGYSWAAQDGNGHTYAYAEKPEKGSFAWRSEAAAIIRLKAGNYDVLDFEQAEPLYLQAMFSLECAHETSD